MELHALTLADHSYVLLYKLKLDLKLRQNYLVGEVDIGSMVDQFFKNSHISFLGYDHEGCLLRALESN